MLSTLKTIHSSSLYILFRLTYAGREGGNKPPNVTDGQQRLIALTCISAIRDQLLIEGEYEKGLSFMVKYLLRIMRVNYCCMIPVMIWVLTHKLWALKPRKFGMARGKNEVGAGTPNRLRTEVPIKLPWNICEITFNQLKAMSKAPVVRIKGDPTVKAITSRLFNRYLQNIL